MTNKRLLISYAHPDDESFGSGAVIAKYVAEGVDVYLICATDGAQGTLPEEMRDQYDSIRDLRLSELDCAAETLGLKRVINLGYRDSGMMNDESINNPDCLWYQWQNNPAEVTSRVVDAIREIQPQVIVTFNEYGGYGHPDHIAIQRATREAFDLAGDATYTGSTLPPYQPQKLYYQSLPRTMMRVFLFMMRLRGQDPRKQGVNGDIDFVKIMDHMEPSHASVDIADYLAAQDEASACHVSQGGGLGSRFPLWVRRIINRKQGFTRVIPAPPQDRVDEHDLFAGVVVDEPQQELTP